MMEKYFVIKVKIAESGLFEKDDIVATAYEKFGCEGVEEISLEESEVDSLLGQDAFCGGNLPEELMSRLDDVAQKNPILKFYFQSTTVNLFVEYLKTNTHIEIIELDEIENEDWNESWRQSFQRIDLEGGLSIVPEWEVTSCIQDDELIIYPGMGFGTGGHETTKLCLELMLKHSYLINFDRVLDFGCGSGILGIAAALKCQAKEVVLVDIDNDAIDNALHNIALNLNGHKLNSKFHCFIRENFHSEQNFSFVFANILLEVLVKEKIEIDKNLERGGYLIVSGILNQQRGELLNTYADYHVIEERSLGDWRAILLKR